MPRKIRCVLIEDDPKQLQLLELCCENLLESYCEVISTYSSAEKFLNEQKRLSYDLLMLDIDLDGMKGTDLARLVDKPVVFVTGRKEYDPEVLDLQFQQDNIITRITKPVDKFKVEHAFKKFLQSQSKSPTIVFNTNRGERNILLDDILLITTKADGFKKGVLFRYDIDGGKFHSRNKILVTEKDILILNQIDFDDLNKRLPSPDFREINKSTLISRKAIKGYNTDGLSLNELLKQYVSEAQFNVSEDYLREFKRWLKQ